MRPDLPEPAAPPAKPVRSLRCAPESYWKNFYFEHDENYFEKQIGGAKRHLDFHEGMKALDIGVGIGKAATALMRAKFDAWGIEPSGPFHARALEFTGLPVERIKLASVDEADFPEESFDFITFSAVLEHLYDPSRAIARTLAWLKPNGVIHIEVPSSDHLVSKIINGYFRLIGTNLVTNISPMHRPFHIHEFTLDSFRRNGALNGYEIADHYFDVASIYHLPRIVHPLLRFIMARAEMGMQLTVWLRKPN